MYVCLVVESIPSTVYIRLMYAYADSDLVRFNHYMKYIFWKVLVAPATIADPAFQTRRLVTIYYTVSSPASYIARVYIALLAGYIVVVSI